MRIALFDYRVIATNPVGSCHLRMLAGLCDTHDFTVYAVEFHNPRPERIRWVRIPLPVRPYLLLYALYHVAAPLAYAFQRMRGARYDLVQMVESNLSFGDLSYSHFCHRMYLARHWRETKARGLRGVLRGLAHRAAAIMEPATYRRVRHIVAPSRGLVGELTQTYPAATSKIHVLPNSVDVDRMAPPPYWERDAFRRRCGCSASDVALIFVALGHFERKGLPLLMEAMQQVSDPSIKLIVVGGEPGTLADYRARTERMGLGEAIRFEGMQQDLRLYYWAGDAFVLPSCYEVFPLVALEAAAAGLPLLVTEVNGVVEMLRDGENGIAMERSVQAIAAAIRRLSLMAPAERRRLGANARQTAMQYRRENFVNAWRELYDTVA
jgi:glycosyltransferase involved in cell wall biosynthesis